MKKAPLALQCGAFFMVAVLDTKKRKGAKLLNHYGPF